MIKKISWLVAIGDVILLLLFAYGGEVTHELAIPDSLVLSVLQAALPFALAWFPAAFALAALADPHKSRPSVVLARAAAAWLIAAPLGIIVRGWILSRAVIPMTFVLVTYALGLAFFVGWRLLLILFFKIQKPDSKEI